MSTRVPWRIGVAPNAKELSILPMQTLADDDAALQDLGDVESLESCLTSHGYVRERRVVVQGTINRKMSGNRMGR